MKIDEVKEMLKEALNLTEYNENESDFEQQKIKNNESHRTTHRKNQSHHKEL